MAVLFIPDQDISEKDPSKISAFFAARGIRFEQWPTPAQLPHDADQETVLGAYAKELQPMMESEGYQTADVINIHPGMENIEAISKKFLSEHTHSEDEVRFFVDGEGLFWFNPDNGEPVYCLLCERGDLISVPAGTKHWFDFGPKRFVKCIRVFIDPSGWVADYTGSDVADGYNQLNLGNRN